MEFLKGKEGKKRNGRGGERVLKKEMGGGWKKV